jgi:hypothetical protein
MRPAARKQAGVARGSAMLAENRPGSGDPNPGRPGSGGPNPGRPGSGGAAVAMAMVADDRISSGDRKRGRHSSVAEV